MFDGYAFRGKRTGEKITRAYFLGMDLSMDHIARLDMVFSRREGGNILTPYEIVCERIPEVTRKDILDGLPHVHSGDFGDYEGKISIDDQTLNLVLNSDGRRPGLDGWGKIIDIIDSSGSHSKSTFCVNMIPGPRAELYVSKILDQSPRME